MADVKRKPHRESKAGITSGSVVPAKQYRDSREQDNQKKLAAIVSDIHTGRLSKLTLVIARQYGLGDKTGYRAQRELSAQGLLVKQGRSFVVGQTVAA